MASKSYTQILWLQPLLLCTALLLPAAAWAGEVKFGPAPLAVDDDGKLTSEGSAAATTTLQSVPGEELWSFNLWAKLDKGGPGPLYIEFQGTMPGGKKYVTYRHEHAEYNGEKFVSLSFDLEGNLGFNKGKTYTVRVLQAPVKGKKDIILATSKVTLAFTEPPPPDEADDSEDANDSAAQDELDTLAGPDDADVGDEPEGPPAIDPASSKKGCSIGAPGLQLPAGLAGLFLLGFARRRRK